MENLKEINQILQEKNQSLKIENQSLKQEIENIKSKTIKNYENKIIELEKELKRYKEREIEIKENTRQYFQLKTKNKFRQCPFCDVQIKESSWSNHKISKYHIANTKEQE